MASEQLNAIAGRLYLAASAPDSPRRIEEIAKELRALAAQPKPAEGGAVAIMQALLNKLHSVANEHGDRSCDYDVCKEVRDAFQFIQTAGSGEAVPLPEPVGWCRAEGGQYRTKIGGMQPHDRGSGAHGPWASLYDVRGLREYAETVAAPLRERLRSANELHIQLHRHVAEWRDQAEEARAMLQFIRPGFHVLGGDFVTQVWWKEKDENGKNKDRHVTVREVGPGAVLSCLSAAIDSAMGSDNAD